MRRFTFFTRKYENELKEFVAKATEAKAIYIEKNEFFKRNEEFALGVAIADKNTFCEILLGLLMDISVSENPIYKHSAKLRIAAEGLNNTPIFTRELRRLKEFLSESRELNIDGYVIFRMNEFKEKLDMMVYSLVKKIKFGARE